MKNNNLKNGGEFSCDTCLKCKVKKQISRVQPRRATRPLELIHSDIAGPVDPPSLGGNRYVLTFTDDYSRYSWVFPIQYKSQCFSIFKSFKSKVENQLNFKISSLHCDNGGEYTGNEFLSFLESNGIQALFTAPYSPEQNGVAERLNQTLFNTVRCLLNDSPCLSKPMWGELVGTACYLKNRSPTSANSGFCSPFEVLYQHAPAVSHLHVIGSRCYSRIVGRNIGKLGERAEKCILLGYEGDHIFRLYEEETGRVLRSRDVVFTEDLKELDDILSPPSSSPSSFTHPSPSTSPFSPSSSSLPDPQSKPSPPVSSTFPPSETDVVVQLSPATPRSHGSSRHTVSHKFTSCHE